jgi:hypothetical protein
MRRFDAIIAPVGAFGAGAGKIYPESELMLPGGGS